MRSLKVFSLTLGLAGAILLAIGIHRGYYPYTSEGSYFDSSTGIVYAEQTTEMFQIFGFVLLATAIISFVKLRRSRVS